MTNRSGPVYFAYITRSGPVELSSGPPVDAYWSGWYSATCLVCHAGPLYISYVARARRTGCDIAQSGPVGIQARTRSVSAGPVSHWPKRSGVGIIGPPEKVVRSVFRHVFALSPDQLCTNGDPYKRSVDAQPLRANIALLPFGARCVRRCANAKGGTK